MTRWEVFLDVFGGLKLHARPWALTLQLVLFDRLQMLAASGQWGVRAWHVPYALVPDGMRRLHEAWPALPHPPPLAPPDAAIAPAAPPAQRAA